MSSTPSPAASPERVGRRAERGQSTVELVVVLPVLVLVVLAVVQAGTVARDAIAVAAAAREAARAAALGGDQRATRDAAVAAGGLDPQRVTVEVLDAGDDVRVVVRYRAPTEVPMVGPLVADVDLSSAVTMRRER